MSREQASPLLSSLIAMMLLLAAGLIIVLLAAIGWAAWERAGLTARWLAMNREVSAARAEAEALSQLATASRFGAGGSLAGLPADADVARLVAGLRAEAAACGATIVEITSLPLLQTSALPRRCYLLRARGSGPQLVGLLMRTAENAPSGARIEDVSLQVAGAGGELNCKLFFAVRPPNP
ncbi:MAG TPA: hypothetical protein PLJ35_08725 [Anaerolineae bacterium]|nr:hypothetical protein [Anaerolineae bacterium]HOQ98892.1 hypothetical protein [Anaerolineae bacterium]HPL29971.1 hypothetical protein [Anaerolineae bacterium]